MSATYTITAGDNSTDLGIVGTADSLKTAQQIGREAVASSLPQGHGTYKVRDAQGREAACEERSTRTAGEWVSLDV